MQYHFEQIERMKDWANRAVATLNLHYRENLSYMRHKNGSAAKVSRVLDQGLFRLVGFLGQCH